MARRRRRRSHRTVLFVLLGAAAVFAAGLWLGGWRSKVPSSPSPGRASVSGERRAAPRPAPAARPAAKPVAPMPAPHGSEVESLPAARPGAPAARIALVIDDLGRSHEEIDRLQALGVPLAYAVLPSEPLSREIAERLRAAGEEVLVHLPMEAVGGGSPGPDAVLERLSPERIAALTRAAIEQVPGAVGLNNHMGSRVTADEAAMRAILAVVGGKGLFFLDSRTTAETGAFGWAREAGIPAARRDVFLDDDPDAEKVAAEFARLLELARQRGAAIAIGHPRPATFEVLERDVPRARAAGFEFVPVSYLLERTEALPE